MMVLNNYPMPPRACVYCMGTTVPCVDIQRDDEESFGPLARIYLCSRCALHAVHLLAPRLGIEVVTKALLESMAESKASLTAELAEACGERDRAFAARDAVLASVRPVSVTDSSETVTEEFAFSAHAGPRAKANRR